MTKIVYLQYFFFLHFYKIVDVDLYPQKILESGICTFQNMWVKKEFWFKWLKNVYGKFFMFFNKRCYILILLLHQFYFVYFHFSSFFTCETTLHYQLSFNSVDINSTFISLHFQITFILISYIHYTFNSVHFHVKLTSLSLYLHFIFKSLSF